MSSKEEEPSPFTAVVDPSFKTRTWELVTSPKHSIPNGITELEDLIKTGDAKQLKLFIRHYHWPPQHVIRKHLWWKIANSRYEMSSSIYKEMVTDMFGSEKQVNVSLPSFVDPSSMHQFHLSELGVKLNKKVLCIVGKSRPDVTYAPLLYALSCLLLHYMEEQQVFDVLEGLLSQKSKHILQTKVSCEASGYVVQELVKKYAKKFYNYLVQENLVPVKVFSDWIWWIFRDLPFYHLVRVVDCYLNEGPKVLYRIVLAIIKLFYKTKIKNSNGKLDGNISIAISQFVQDMPGINTDLLLKTAFKIGGFSKKELDKIMVKQEMYVTSLKNTEGLQKTLTKSPSCESLNDKITVSRSFSLQEIGSTLLQQKDWNTIWNWIPDRIKLLTPELIFSTSEHGTSLSTFYKLVENRESCPATLLVVKTVSNKLIGAYCSADWAQRKNDKKSLAYFGTGESFVFELQSHPTTTQSNSTALTPGGIDRKYQWVGVTLRDETPSTAQYFMSGDNSLIQIGGGGGVALKLDEDMNHGESHHCMTFDNPPLGGDEYFDCATVEVFGFR